MQNISDCYSKKFAPLAEEYNQVFRELIEFFGYLSIVGLFSVHLRTVYSIENFEYGDFLILLSVYLQARHWGSLA